MPLTTAHAVAAIPLRRPLGRFGVMSALVIGSFTPDFPYFLPIVLTRNATHDVAGVFWFCLPVGLLAYVLFHHLLDQPIRALLPEALQRRCAVLRRSPAPPVWSMAVVLSVCCGALTHVVWDAFTHGGGAAVRLLPGLERRIFTVSGYTVYAFTVLQHCSSLGGTALLFWWARRWVLRTPADPAALADPLPRGARLAIVWALLAITCLACVAAGWRHLPPQITLSALQPLVRRVLVGGVSSLTLALVLYAIAWHGYRSRLPADAG